MRLMCVNTDGWVEDRSYLFGLIKIKRDCDGPTYGDMVSVTSSYYEDGVLYYVLLEWPEKKRNDGFQADCFIPLSSIDETEMEGAYKTEKV